MIQIMKLAGQEIIDKKVLQLTLMLTLIFLLLYGVGLRYVDFDQGVSGSYMAIIRDDIVYQLMGLGWYFAALLSGAMAILLGAGSIARETESGTILSLASRPLSRNAIFAGKYLACALMTVIYSSLLLGAIAALLIYFTGLRPLWADLPGGLAIFALQPLALLAVTQWAALKWGSMAGGVAGFILFAVSIAGGFIEQIGALVGNSGLVSTGIIASLLMPADIIYRLALSQASASLELSLNMFSAFGGASLPSKWMLVYIMHYIFLLPAISRRRFARMDF